MPNAWAAGRGGQWLRTSAELEQAFRSTPYDHRAHTLDVVEAEDADLSESMRREGYDMSASDSRPAYRAPSPSAARLDTRLLPRHPELAIAMSSRRGPSCAHPSQSPSEAGSVVGLWRYPVKSMMGEELNAAEITDRGVVGDRHFAVVDATTGKVAGAKNPRKWGNFFDYRAA